MHLIRIDVLQVLSGINASVFVNQPAARLAFKETVVRIVGYIAPTDVTILRVLRVEIAPEQAQTQGQEQEQGQAQMQAEGQGQVQVVLGSPFQLLSTPLEVQVDYNIAFIVEQVGFENVTQAFDVTSRRLQSSVLTGAFEAMLVGIAKNHSVDLLGTSTSRVQSTIQSVQVHIAPSSTPSSAPTPAPTVAEATTADKLVVVVSFLLVCAVMLVACLCVFNARHVLIFLRLTRRAQVQVLDSSALKLRNEEYDARVGQKKNGLCSGSNCDELDKPAFSDREEKTEEDAFSPDARGGKIGSPIMLRDLTRKPAFSSFVRMFDETRIPGISPFTPKKYKIVPGPPAFLSPASPPPLGPPSPSFPPPGSAHTFRAFVNAYSHKGRKVPFYGLADLIHSPQLLSATPDPLQLSASPPLLSPSPPPLLSAPLPPLSTFTPLLPGAPPPLLSAAPLPAGRRGSNGTPDFRAFMDTYSNNYSHKGKGKVVPSPPQALCPPLSPTPPTSSTPAPPLPPGSAGVSIKPNPPPLPPPSLAAGPYPPPPDTMVLPARRKSFLTTSKLS
ncbi:hypothetical protein B484DRAFT_414635 [Ochromonadaceae sp. CCMP2298]|nr:hypothetical protein B484DRAFT_414635 [Ochromonadaceae sp. CCMP2298]